jgi:electron transport complex protein RnfG
VVDFKNGNQTVAREARMEIKSLSTFKSILFIFIVLICTISLLVITNLFTDSKLGLLKDQTTLETIQIIFPKADAYCFDEVTEIYTVYDRIRNKIGYVFYAQGMGESVSGGPEIGVKIRGPTVILVGLEDRETIKGIYVVSHSETPGFWQYLIDKDYFNQFAGLKIEDAYFSRDGGLVDSVSYATLSSKLVLNTVRDTAMEKIKYIE